MLNNDCEQWNVEPYNLCPGQSRTRAQLIDGIFAAATSGASQCPPEYRDEVLAHVALYRAQRNCVRTVTQASNLLDIGQAYVYATTGQWLDATEKLEQGH
mgnify:CR=1 FL=1